MWLNQSQPVSIDTLSCEKGVSASESFNRGHLDNSPRGVWEGCKYKWQLPPPSRASSAKQASLLLLLSSKEGKNPAQSKGKVLLARKFFFFGNHTQLYVSMDSGFFLFFLKSRSYFIRSQVYQARRVSVSRSWNIFRVASLIIKRSLWWHVLQEKVEGGEIPPWPCD